MRVVDVFLAVHHVDSGECDAQEEYCEPTRGLGKNCVHTLLRKGGTCVTLVNKLKWGIINFTSKSLVRSPTSTSRPHSPSLSHALPHSTSEPHFQITCAPTLPPHTRNSRLKSHIYVHIHHACIHSYTHTDPISVNATPIAMWSTAALRLCIGPMMCERHHESMVI